MIPKCYYFVLPDDENPAFNVSEVISKAFEFKYFGIEILNEGMLECLLNTETYCIIWRFPKSGLHGNNIVVVVLCWNQGPVSNENPCKIHPFDKLSLTDFPVSLLPLTLKFGSIYTTWLRGGLRGGYPRSPGSGFKPT